MQNEKQPLPVFVRLSCPTCGGEGVAQKGSQVLCQNCVNAFLAKNVGLMEEVPEQDPDFGTEDGVPNFVPLPPRQ